MATPDKKRYAPTRYSGSTSRSSSLKGPKAKSSFTGNPFGGAYVPLASGSGRSGAPVPGTIRRGDHPRANPRLPQVPKKPREASMSLKDIDRSVTKQSFSRIKTLVPRPKGSYYTSPGLDAFEKAIWGGRKAISPGVAALSAINGTKKPNRYQQTIGAQKRKRK